MENSKFQVHKEKRCQTKKSPDEKITTLESPNHRGKSEMA